MSKGLLLFGSIALVPLIIGIGSVAITAVASAFLLAVLLVGIGQK
jgi:hypothetical protein